MSIQSYTAICGILVVMFGKATSHPQCLAYNVAPSKLDKDLYFCPSFDSKYGCCNAMGDFQILFKHRQIMSSFQLEKEAECSKLLHEVLCLECHPYAAHIYASEGNKNFDLKTATPGLCREFCLTFFQACSDIIRNYYWKTNLWIPKNNASSYLEGSLNVTKEEFCQSVTLPDQDYCYPDVQKVDKKILGRKDNQEISNGRFCADLVALSVRNPVAALHANDDTKRMFVVEQLGEIQVFVNSSYPQGKSFLDIKSKVLTSARYGDERGLLSAVFHPEYSSNGRVFVYYSAAMEPSNINVTRQDEKTVLSEYRVSADDPNRVNHSSETIILEVAQPAANHNGGQLLFGIDGYLYLSLGDGGRGGDPFGKIGNGLNRSTLLGSIIRIDVNTDNDSPYKIPADNPFIKVPGARAEIFAYGTRNMWRCSIDRGDKETQEGRGRMFCGDVGQNRFEEIDIITKGGNYGWRAYEGFSCYDSNLCNKELTANAIPPIFSYDHTVGKSVVGGYVYRGTRNPTLKGKYIFGDTWSGKLFLLTENKISGQWKEEKLVLGNTKRCTGVLVGKIPRFILSFGEDEEGEIYILATDFPDTQNDNGKVYRLVEVESAVSRGRKAWSGPMINLLIAMMALVNFTAT